MYSGGDCQDNYPGELAAGDSRLAELAKKLTDLADGDIVRLIEVSHALPYISQLEGGDAYIDILTRDNGLAVVAAQHSPPEGNFYRHSIVGDIMWRKNEPGVYRTFELGVPSRELKALVHDEKIVVRQNASPITGDGGRVIGVLIVERNLHRDHVPAGRPDPARPVHDEPLYSGREMQSIAQHMNDAMLRFDPQGVCVYANPKAVELFQGLSYRDDIVGMAFENLAFGSYTISQVRDRGQIEHTEIKVGQYDLNVRYVSVVDEGEFKGVVLIIRDTTEIKTAEKQLILKSTAIDEIHHRVKNNLQTIVSLIGLQANRSDSDQVKQFANTIISRIHSISVTHEILAHSLADSIDIRELLGKMLASSKNYIVPDDLDLDIQLVGDNISLQSSTATTIAMVVNELIQNCIKHAFIGQASGAILLRIEKGDVFSRITITDDGVGIGETHRNGSMGLKLVHSLVRDKLKGDMEFTALSPGTQVSFTFVCKEHH